MECKFQVRLKWYLEIYKILIENHAYPKVKLLSKSLQQIFYSMWKLYCIAKDKWLHYVVLMSVGICVVS